MSIYGIDVSHYQSNETVNKAIKNGVNGKKISFLIAKASEGKSMKDEMFNKHMNQAIGNKLAVGCYHYAHPELNNAIDEAKNYLNTIAPYLNNNLVLALDWEGKSIRLDSNLAYAWIDSWMDTVYIATGRKPLFYTSYAYQKRYDEIALDDIGLWCARYNSKMGDDFGSWKRPVMWQFSSEPVDQNEFFGNIEQFNAYGKDRRTTTEDEQDKVCETKCYFALGEKEKCILWRKINEL